MTVTGRYAKIYGREGLFRGVIYNNKTRARNEGGIPESWSAEGKTLPSIAHPDLNRNDLVRKLDPIEVNLLRLEKRLKDVGK